VSDITLRPGNVNDFEESGSTVREIHRAERRDHELARRRGSAR